MTSRDLSGAGPIQPATGQHRDEDCSSSQPQGACVQVEGLRESIEHLQYHMTSFGSSAVHVMRVLNAADRLAQVETERDALAKMYDGLEKLWQVALHQRDAASKALEPFARCGREFWHESRTEEAVHLHDFCGQLKPELTNLTVGDFQRAHQALSDLKEMGE